MTIAADTTWGIAASRKIKKKKIRSKHSRNSWGTTLTSTWSECTASAPRRPRELQGYIVAHFAQFTERRKLGKISSSVFINGDFCKNTVEFIKVHALGWRLQFASAPDSIFAGANCDILQRCKYIGRTPPSHKTSSIASCLWKLTKMAFVSAV